MPRRCVSTTFGYMTCIKYKLVVIANAQISVGRKFGRKPYEPYPQLVLRSHTLYSRRTLSIRDYKRMCKRVWSSSQHQLFLGPSMVVLGVDCNSQFELHHSRLSQVNNTAIQSELHHNRHHNLITKAPQHRNSINTQYYHAGS